MIAFKNALLWLLKAIILFAPLLLICVKRKMDPDYPLYGAVAYSMIIQVFLAYEMIKSRLPLILVPISIIALPLGVFFGLAFPMFFGTLSLLTFFSIHMVRKSKKLNEFLHGPLIIFSCLISPLVLYILIDYGPQRVDVFGIYYLIGLICYTVSLWLSVLFVYFNIDIEKNYVALFPKLGSFLPIFLPALPVMFLTVLCYLGFPVILQLFLGV